mmetsp:Transcript_40674/g.49501  ORF Transcript_40674/g.49501 Transcript_40674/m.49501 type:complete len:83 (-) Transcript_40674:11-259(-)
MLDTVFVAVSVMRTCELISRAFAEMPSLESTSEEMTAMDEASRAVDVLSFEMGSSSSSGGSLGETPVKTFMGSTSSPSSSMT